MKRLESILVATDFSDPAHHAVRKAALLAEHHDARLTLLHVVNPAGSTSLRQWFGPSIDIDLKVAQARATLRRFAAEIDGRHGVAARFQVVVGEAFDEIRRASEGAELLVLGKRGRSRIRNLVTGGTADRLLRLCRRPMLIVKAPLDGLYRSILVPVDFTASSQACLLSAAGLVRTAKIHVLHALDSNDEFEMRMADVPDAEIRDHRDIVDAELNIRMQGLAAKAEVESSRLATAVRRGPAWASTLDHAGKQGADLIVVGKHGASAVAEFLLGSVTRRLLAESTCDLMVLPRAAVETLRARHDVQAGRALPARGRNRDARPLAPTPSRRAS